jgi:hypothetical protein
MTDIVRTIGPDGGLALRFAGSALRELPASVLADADQLTMLDVSGHQLTTLPDWLPELPRLKIIFASRNPFVTLPPILGACPALTMVGFRSCQITHVPAAALPTELQWLILTDNQLRELPNALGERPALQKLMLAGNRLHTLPSSLQQCQRLELLRLAANHFTDFPSWLWSLPSLAWLALAGNPATPLPAPPPHATTPWSELQLGPRLGEGASGEIFSAQWQNSPQPLAVKLFKNTMTSDGDPSAEMAAALTVGAQPPLLGALARVTDHPQGRAGLILPLIKKDFSSLAQPPDYSTCTRDVYDPALRFTPTQRDRLISALTEAMSQLHTRGYLHGDFYAHNVLWHPTAAADEPMAWLGDLGAATALPEKWRAQAQALDQRALIILQEEISSCISDFHSI